MFRKLVKFFYTNLNYKDWVITTKVYKTQIYFSIEEFDIIYDLPYTCSLYTSDAPSSMDNFDI